MHVLMLSWEFPPLVVGGIARHVHDLSLSLARQGIEVTVLTAGNAEARALEKSDRLTIRRVLPMHPRAQDLVGRVMQLNLVLLEQALSLTRAGERFSLVHAHDWVTAYAGKALKHGLDLPLIATIHATEYGRNNGLHDDLQEYISDVEWWLCYEAWRVICCSRFMAGEIQRVFQLPADKIHLLPNGVFSEEFASRPIPPGFRARFAAPDEMIVLHVGRLVREKGLHILLDAMPGILARHPQTKLIIAGRGDREQALCEQARRLGIDDRVYFTGYVDDMTRNLLYRLADVTVFPSLYEPFGIVALEAMAAGVPVVVADTGGMSEIVVHGRNGLKMETGSPASLAENVLWLFGHEEQAASMRRHALADLARQYCWEDIAAKTRQVYQEVLTAAVQTAQARPPYDRVCGCADEAGQINRYTHVAG